jgi:dTDP-glucose 4,6-dehydratase
VRVLITGSRGVIGSKLTELFPGSYGIDLFHDPREKGWQHEMSGLGDYSRCDVADFRQLERVFRDFRPELVYHTAAEFGRWNGEDYYEQLWRTNAIGTKNIIRLQEDMGFKLVHFSSSEVYGDYGDMMFEDVMNMFEVRQLNDYAMSKWVNEMQIENSQKQFDTKTVRVRIFNTYGPGEWYHAYRSVNSKFCYHALFGLPVTVYKGHTRTSTFLDDSCRTISNIATNFKPGEVYNIGGNYQHSMEELVDTIWDYVGANRRLITYKDSEILTTKDKKVSSKKAEKDLDHKITVDLKEGVKRTIDWMREYYATHLHTNNTR